MKLEDIARFGYFFVDKKGNLLGFDGEVLPLKYGELMGNDAAEVRGPYSSFELLNERPVGFVNHIDGLAAARFMLTTGGTGIFKHTGIFGKKSSRCV